MRQQEYKRPKDPSILLRACANEAFLKNDIQPHNRPYKMQSNVINT